MTTSSFGSRVVGEKAAAEAMAAQKGGADVFGKRVLNSVSIPTSEAVAKAQSQFGAHVIGGAHASDTKGKSGSVSVEDLENLLDENPTFFDSLYEAELSRKEGARVAALRIFLNVEYGIKGAGRQSIIQEIRGMLGENSVTARQSANDLLASAKSLEAREERMKENELLQDAGRIKSLKERDDNLKALDKSDRKSTSEQVGEGSANTDTQKRAIAGKEGLDLGDPSKPGEPILPSGVAGVSREGGEGRGAHTDLKESDTKPESQTQAPRNSQKETAETKPAAKKTAAKKSSAKKKK